MKFDSPVPETRYESADEASRRLIGGIVVFKDKPYHVVNISSDLLATLASTNSISHPNPLNPIPLSDPGFNYFKDFPSGYYNHEGGGSGRDIYPTYFDRLPARRVRHSMTSENTMARTLSGPLQFNDVVSRIGFIEMVGRVYPTLSDLFALVPPNPTNRKKTRELTGLALSRDFAVILSGGLLKVYSPDWTFVGVIVSEDSFVIPKHVGFIEEAVRESGVFDGLTVKVL